MVRPAALRRSRRISPSSTSVSLFPQNTLAKIYLIKIVSRIVKTLRNRDFRRLWISGGISGIGSWLLVVAIPFHVFDLTGSTVATGLTLALEALPALLLGPWAGVLLDRWDLSRAMWIAELVSAAAVALILFADADRIWLIYLAILAENVATMVFRPASRALLPAVVGTGNELAGRERPERLDRQHDPARRTATRRTAAGRSGHRVRAGRRHRQLFVVSGNHRDRPDPPTPDQFRDVTTPRRIPVRRPATGRSAESSSARRLFLTANAGLTALLVPFAVDRLQAPGYVVGYLISGLGVGYLIGAALSTRAATWLGTRDLLALTQFATAAAFFALFNAPSISWAVVAASPDRPPRQHPSDHRGDHDPANRPDRHARSRRRTLLRRRLPRAPDRRASRSGRDARSSDLVPTLNVLAAFAVLAAPLTLAVVPRHPAAFTRISTGA